MWELALFGPRHVLEWVFVNFLQDCGLLVSPLSLVSSITSYELLETSFLS